ncbi:MAG: metal ABC transporter substrate-binding protein [Anaerolineae bacterium]
MTTPRQTWVRQFQIRLIVAAFILVSSVAGCATASPPATGGTGPEASQPPADASDRQDGRLNVASTVSPITNIVHNVGGDRIRLAGIVPEGVNSHTFEPAPGDARQLAVADIIFVNGLNLELPTIKLAEANLKPGAEIVTLADKTIARDQWVFDFSFPQERGDPNPHLWLNPMHALRYAEIVRDTLSDRDPGNAGYYAENYGQFKARIEALDQAIQASINAIPADNRQLVTYHDSFAYFAPRYGMTVIAAIQPSDFSEPSPREVAGIIQQLREVGVPAIFGSEVFPSPVLDQIGKEADIQFVDTLRDDDLPGRPGDREHSYIGMMVEDVRIMARALGGDPSPLDEVDPSNVPGTDSDVDQAQ